MAATPDHHHPLRHAKLQRPTPYPSPPGSARRSRTTPLLSRASAGTRPGQASYRSSSPAVKIWLLDVLAELIVLIGPEDRQNDRDQHHEPGGRPDVRNEYFGHGLLSLDAPCGRDSHGRAGMCEAVSPGQRDEAAPDMTGPGLRTNRVASNHVLVGPGHRLAGSQLPSFTIASGGGRGWLGEPGFALRPARKATTRSRSRSSTRRRSGPRLPS